MTDEHADSTDDFRDWIGRSEEATDIVAPMRVAEMNATLDRDDPFPGAGDDLPPLYHWMFAGFLGVVRTSDLGADGHPRRGLFLPPVTLPRRMWAASDVTFHAALRVGDSVIRRAVIENIENKTGRSGRLTFVTVRHYYAGPIGPALGDCQTIVYREAPAPAENERPPAPRPAPLDAEFSRTLTPGIAMLFRYSALIFNAHRIHFDRDFATGEEGYPGLVVHGPLVATLLADLARRQRPDARITRIRFRAVAPLFEGREMTLAGRESPGGLTLWAADDRGALAAEAQVSLES
ncbi:MAG: MaoC family dehydratase N-terminal domain-containing protein [Alphaproteobacteria bacterium]